MMGPGTNRTGRAGRSQAATSDHRKDSDTTMSSLADDGTPLAEVATPPDGWAQLSLPELRRYRRQLAEEEEKVSYWRRLVHARIDVLEAEAHHERSLTVDELIRVLGDTGTGRSRTALVRVRAADELPELPVLHEMWVTELDPNDGAAVSEAIARLRSAEAQLTDYRRALHERLDQATAELIARYRAEPRSALVAFAAPHSGLSRGSLS
jgi:anti-sigma-K factor RsiG